MKKVALIFPGQGAQAVGMGQALYDNCPAAREVFDQADAILGNHLKEVIFSGPAERLTSTAYCQPAILTMSVAALRALTAHEKYAAIEPVFTAGLSLGEYAALVAGGALSFEETLRLVERRSAFMEEAAQAHPGRMAAIIGLEREQIQTVCDQVGAEVANFNSPQQTVITGVGEQVEAAAALLKEAGAKNVVMLEVSGAFHSSLMQPAADRFEEELKKVNLRMARVPIVANVDACPATDPDIIRANLAAQITSSVQWVDSVLYMAGQGVTDFIEIGPGTVLKGLIRRINRDLNVQCIQEPGDIEKLSF